MRTQVARALSVFLTQRGAGYAGLYFAPVVPTIGLAFISSGDLGWSGLVATIEWCSICYPLSLVLGALIGLPIFYVLASVRRVNWWACLFGGFVAGAVVSMLIGALSTLQSHAILLYGLLGAGAALVFWLFWQAGPEPTPTNAQIWTRGLVGRVR